MTPTSGRTGTIENIAYLSPGDAVIKFKCGAKHTLHDVPYGLKAGDMIMIDEHGRIWRKL